MKIHYLTTLSFIVILSACQSNAPTTLGLNDNVLVPCPSRDNCVYSLSKKEKYQISPFQVQSTAKADFQRLASLVTEQEGKIIKQTENYLHAEFTSGLMKFVDDLELFYNDESVIHVKSASRLGYSDFGVNRERVEQLRQSFQTTPKS